MAMTDAFETLVAEGAAVPVEGWDFSWFEGRATEERPPESRADRCARGCGGGRAHPPVRRRCLRTRRESTPGGDPLGRDRPRAPAGRHLPLAADRGREQSRTDRLHDGPAAGEPEP